MTLDDLAANGRSQSGAALPAWKGERLKQLRDQFRGKAGSGVLDFREDPAPV